MTSTASVCTKFGSFSILFVALAFAPAFGLVNPAEPVHYTILGAPYSGQVTMEEAANLSDGSRVVRSTKSWKVFRDSEGRTRDENSPTGGLRPTLEIADPVAGYVYTLDTTRHIAERRKLPPVRTLRPAGQPPQTGPQAQSLGMKTIEGLAVYGSVRNVLPDGSTAESWWSPALNISLQSKNTRLGTEYTTQITNILRAEPDPSLFQVPADYSIAGR